MNAHRLGELRSIAYHRRVAELLADNPQIVVTARDRLVTWLRDRPRNARAARQWLDMLDGPREALVEVMIADNELARELRQSTPFAGALDPRERWALWNAVREHDG